MIFVCLKELWLNVKTGERKLEKGEMKCKEKKFRSPFGIGW